MRYEELRLPQKRYEKPLEEFVQRTLDTFDDKVVSIVLFGSVARDEAREYSDLDLLIIIKESGEEIGRTLRGIKLEIGSKFGTPFMIISATPSEIESSIDFGNPLFYGILTGYKILFDRNDFFSDLIETFKERVRIEKPIYIAGGKEWRLAEIV